MKVIWALALLTTLLLACGTTAAAIDNEHATSISARAVYAAPSSSSAKVATIDRGHDLIILERTKVDQLVWCKVFANILGEDRPREITGWLLAPGLVTTSTPKADQIIFGEAVDSENQAEQRGGRKGAAEDAMRLYYRAFDMFPNSPLAPESLWRSADIRWQLDKVRSLSAGQQVDIDEGLMRQIQKRFPHSKWADLAAYEMIDNKLCREWKGLPECPEKETQIYTLYATEHPQSPKAAEALYNAAWRQAALADIYRIQDEAGKSANARNRGINLAREIMVHYPDVDDWSTRSSDLIYKLEQKIPIYGIVDPK